MTKESGINITKAVFPAPFESGLEYNPPTRGVWNIVHTGMLIPESRQIFVCAQGCLRGVILTAAEMNAMDRMSWVTVYYITHSVYNVLLHCAVIQILLRNSHP